MRALYVSHNGMLEGLGQSQVLPYLRGLARRGIEFDLFSYELPESTDDEIATLLETLTGSGIHWTPMRRRRDPRLRVKLAEIGAGVARAFASAIARRPAIVHGRSYVPTAVGDAVATLLPKAKLVFDCRGMLGDEYVDAGYWSARQKEYRLLKRYEKRAFSRAEGVVVLTEALRHWVERSGLLGAETKLTTIPTCVDLGRFRFDERARIERRHQLGFPQDALVVVYSGSLSELYCVDEMARFVGHVRRVTTRPVRLLVLTTSNADGFASAACAAGLTPSEIVVGRVQPDAVASYLSASDIGLSFGKSCFARLGCSPTKLAEYLACGVVVATNAGFGDQGELANEPDTCVVVDAFEDDALFAASRSAIALADRPADERVAKGRAVADARFGLETVGVRRYEDLYRSLVSDA